METELTPYYIKGFNNAYFLAQHNPSLLNQLIKLESETDYVKGLHDGKKTYDLEQQKSRIKDLQHLRKKSNRDLER